MQVFNPSSSLAIRLPSTDIAALELRNDDRFEVLGIVLIFLAFNKRLHKNAVEARGKA